MRRTTGALIGLAAMAASVPMLLTPAHADPTTSCSFTDGTGDTGFIADIGSGLYGEGNLDIVAADATWDAGAQRLVFTIELEDLNDLGLPPLGSNGEYFDFNFTLNGEDYTAQYFHSRADGDEQSRLAYYGELGRTTLATSNNSAIDFAVDREADTIQILIPAIIEHDTDGVVFELTDNSSINALEVVARREIVVLVPDADTAAPTDGCSSIQTPGVVGGSAEGLDLGDSVTFSGAATLDAQGQCELDPCLRESFLVDATSGELVVTLANVDDQSGLSDLDLFLTGVGGKHESVSVGNDEEIRIPLEPGRVGGYIVSVHAHTAAFVTFDVVVEVVAAEA